MAHTHRCVDMDAFIYVSMAYKSRSLLLTPKFITDNFYSFWLAHSFISFLFELAYINEGISMQ
jgi:hypothetical protein